VFALQGVFATVCARRDEEGVVAEPGTEDTRRERARRRTLHELDAAALEEVREHGAVELSLRRVARRMGMSPAGLYRYVDSREALLTRLIAGAYHDLADHLAVATGEVPRPRDLAGRPVPAPSFVVDAGSDVAVRMRAAALAYRHWSVTHPQEFGLLFGDPIPGYEAPPGGETVEAMSRVGIELGRPVVHAWLSGRLRPLRFPSPEPEVVAGLTAMTQIAGTELPPEVGLTLLVAWGRLHGQVSLEVFNHHRWLFPDGCEELFRADLEAMLRDLGIATDERP
jgi:AcrR family transcriptional regulator